MPLTLELFVRKRLTFQDLNNKIQKPIQDYINLNCVLQDEVSTDIAANKIIRRDANGRVKVAAPVAADDIARKAEVDYLRNRIQSTIQVSINLQYHGRLQAGAYTPLYTLPHKIPTGKTLYLERAVYNLRSSSSLRLEVGVHSLQTGYAVRWVSSSEKGDDWLGYPIQINNPNADLVLVSLRNTSSSDDAYPDNRDSIWVQFLIWD